MSLHESLFPRRLWISSNESPNSAADFFRRSVAPEKVLMVGDALTDWEGAKRAGTAFIGIQTGMSSSISSDIILLRNLTLLKEHLFQDLV
jgi:phosphoglycolate phosphatase-like HAD superfamily hydrolase